MTMFNVMFFVEVMLNMWFP